MSKRTVHILATVLSTVGILFILAMSFGVVRSNYALFAGVACFILAGTVEALAETTD